MSVIRETLQSVRARIESAERQCARAPGSVALLAVTKTVPAAVIRQAWLAGQTRFGESYTQEALGKMQELADLPIEWHFIGPLQSNKTRAVAANFAWVHSIDREKVAQRLADQRDVHLPPLQVCVQVNVSGEASKSGVMPEQAGALALAVSRLPRLALRGLMCIPEPTDDPAVTRARFCLLRQLRDELNARCSLAMDTLSMGMSDDLELAVAEGATLLRVGSALFGERPPIAGHR